MLFFWLNALRIILPIYMHAGTVDMIISMTYSSDYKRYRRIASSEVVSDSMPSISPGFSVFGNMLYFVLKSEATAACQQHCQHEQDQNGKP